MPLWRPACQQWRQWQSRGCHCCLRTLEAAEEHEFSQHRNPHYIPWKWHGYPSHSTSLPCGRLKPASSAKDCDEVDIGDSTDCVRLRWSAITCREKARVTGHGTVERRRLTGVVGMRRKCPPLNVNVSQRHATLRAGESNAAPLAFTRPQLVYLRWRAGEADKHQFTRRALPGHLAGKNRCRIATAPKAARTKIVDSTRVHNVAPGSTVLRTLFAARSASKRVVKASCLRQASIPASQGRRIRFIPRSKATRKTLPSLPPVVAAVAIGHPNTQGLDAG